MPLPHPLTFDRVVNVLDYYVDPVNPTNPNPFVGDSPPPFDEPDATDMINAALTDLGAAYGGYGTNVSLAPGAIPLTVAIPFRYVLYFPPGRYRINSRIIITASFNGLHIIGDGALLTPTDDAVFLDENDEEDFAFQHIDCYAVKVEGMNFAGFKKAVRFTATGGQESAMLQVNNCSFQNNSVVGLEIACNSGIFEMENCKLMNNGLSINSLSGGICVVLKKCWIYSKEDGLSGVHACVISNSSNLLLESCVLVPLPTASDSIEPAWINNYGSLTVKDTRQGGEPGSFTLINNFAGLGNLYDGGSDVSAVIVKDSNCYGIYDSNSADPNPPVILRYVTGIPNLTAIVNNRGMKSGGSVLGFSKQAGLTTSSAINAMILASAGGTTALVNSYNICVNVSNNAGGVGWPPTGSIIPGELHPFVRDKADLWPITGNSLLRLNPWDANNGMSVNDPSLVDSTGKRIFKFEYPADLRQALMINFSGDPNTAGSGLYSAGFVGILKSNGFVLVGTLGLALKLQPLFNQSGDTDVLDVDVYWESTNNPDIYYDNANGEVVGGNRNFIIRIGGTDGNWDNIVVTPIDNFMG